MFVTVVLYWNGTFGARADDWRRILELTKVAFGWNDMRFASGMVVGKMRPLAQLPLNEKRLELIAKRVAKGELEGVWLSERSSGEEWESPPRPNQAYLSAHYRALRNDTGQPAAHLPNDVQMVAQLGPAWPIPEQRAAIMEMAKLVGAQYGCVWVGIDHDRARSESLLCVTTDWQSPDPEWRHEINHRSRNRWQFGPRVRGAYWGNILAADVVAELGGIDALQGIGSVERVGNGTTYVQLTPTVGEALGEAGQERMARLQKVLVPVLV